MWFLVGSWKQVIADTRDSALASELLFLCGLAFTEVRRRLKRSTRDELVRPTENRRLKNNEEIFLFLAESLYRFHAIVTLDLGAANAR